MMLDEARDAIENDGAEAILLGCAGLGPIDKTMQEALGVPVFDGTACAVTLLEGLHRYGVTTAKVRAYLTPEPKELVACPGSLAAIYERDRAAVVTS
jgi:allantoin racemase